MTKKQNLNKTTSYSPETNPGKIIEEFMKFVTIQDKPENLKKKVELKLDLANDTSPNAGLSTSTIYPRVCPEDVFLPDDDEDGYDFSPKIDTSADIDDSPFSVRYRYSADPVKTKSRSEDKEHEVTIKPGRKEKNINCLINYLKMGDLDSLHYYLIKNNYIHEATDCFIFDPDLNIHITDSESFMAIYRKNLSSCLNLIFNRVTKNLEKIEHEDIPKIDEDNISNIRDNLKNFLILVYLTPRVEKCSFIIRTNEELNHIIRESLKRGVNIDPEILENDFDFEDFRTRNIGVKFLFIGDKINTLFLTHDGMELPYVSNNMFLYFNEVKPKKELVCKETEDEIVIINGKKYSKSLVEGMIECKIETLLNNLELEKIMESSMKPEDDLSNIKIL